MARKKSKAPVAAKAPAGTAARSPQVRAGWIISPFWDSILFIGAPLVVIAGFLPLRSVMSSERIAILSLAFFTFGHHFLKVTIADRKTKIPANSLENN